MKTATIPVYGPVCFMLAAVANILLPGRVCATTEDAPVYYLGQNEKSAPSVYAVTENSKWKTAEGAAAAAGALDESATYIVNGNLYMRTLGYGKKTVFRGKCLMIGESSSTQGRLLIYGGNEDSPLSFEESEDGLVVARGQVSSQQRFNEIRGAVKILKHVNSPTISWSQNDSVLVLRGSLSSEADTELRVGVKDDSKSVTPSNLTLRVFSDCSGFVGSMGIESNVRFDDENGVFGRRIEFGDVKLSGALNIKGVGTILTSYEPGQTVELGKLAVNHAYALRIEVKRKAADSSLIKADDVSFPATPDSVEIKTLWDGIGDIKTSRPVRFPVLEIPYAVEVDESVFKLTSGDTVPAGASLKWVVNAEQTRKTLCVAYPARGAFCISVR